MVKIIASLIYAHYMYMYVHCAWVSFSCWDNYGNLSWQCCRTGTAESHVFFAGVLVLKCDTSWTGVSWSSYSFDNFFIKHEESVKECCTIIYSSIMLDSFASLLCSILCRQNVDSMWPTPAVLQIGPYVYCTDTVCTWSQHQITEHIRYYF